jgi:hypothetical protein
MLGLGQVRRDEFALIRERTAKKAKDTILHKRPHISELVELVKPTLPDFSEPEEPETGPIKPEPGGRP